LRLEQHKSLIRNIFWRYNVDRLVPYHAELRDDTLVSSFSPPPFFSFEGRATGRTVSVDVRGFQRMRGAVGFGATA
jgi:hypothetical protein